MSVVRVVVDEGFVVPVPLVGNIELTWGAFRDVNELAFNKTRNVNVLRKKRKED